jgi:hypothetical protein
MFLPRDLRAILLAAPALASLALLAQPHSAAAQESSWRQEMDDIKNAIPGFGPSHDPIDFTERPPLVVPPNTNLPPPVDTPPRLGLNDPDRFDRAKALSDPRRPVPPTDPGATASGPDRRAFLIDPPSGLENPAAIAAEAHVGTFGDEPKRKRTTPAAYRHRVRHTPAPVEPTAQ